MEGGGGMVCAGVYLPPDHKPDEATAIVEGANNQLFSNMKKEKNQIMIRWYAFSEIRR
jgi:hypothetical protein